MLSCTLMPEVAQGTWFEDVTTNAGINYTGESWGAAWGDFNGDGWPDLWTSNHAALPSLYLNMRDGTFSETAQAVLPATLWSYMKNTPGRYDSHGAAWADFDNDGDQDLLQLADGGSRHHSNHLYVNAGGTRFEDQQQAALLGIDAPTSNSRTPLWLDWNNDGLLDLFTTSAIRNPLLNPRGTLYQRTASGFLDVGPVMGLDIPEATAFAELSDVTNDGKPEIIIGTEGSPSLRIFSANSTHLSEETDNLGIGLLGGQSLDAAVGDFIGTLDMGIHIVRGEAANGVEQPDPLTIEAHLSALNNQRGFSFSATGSVSFSLYPVFEISLSDVYVGSGGSHPSARDFILSTSDPGVIGMPSHIPGIDNGFFIGFDDSTATWTVYLSSSHTWVERNVVVKTGMPISNLAILGFDPLDPPQQDSQLTKINGVFADGAIVNGIGFPSSGRSVVAGDFDNDMDLDLYIVATGPVMNMDNILYENLGNGFFSLLPGAGGAAGTLRGRGDTVSTVDYDQDGFLDLFVTNGKSKPPFEKDGPYQLFRNLGNSNHWLELDLEGVRSNRDAIGARILATAGGVTQVREQGGGMHRRTQNHQRIHFGLAGNTKVDAVTVEWPSGISQTISNLPADEIVHVVEPSVPSLQGKPVYQPGQDAGFYLWKDSFDGPYRIETNGSGPVTKFSVELIADQSLAAVTPRSLEADDTLAWSGGHMTLDSRVSTWIDGVDFQLPPGTHAMFAVTQDGSPNPRQLHIGASGQPMTPSGWILDADSLSAPPAFQGGKDLGLFMGRDPASGELRPRWNGDGPNHRSGVELLFSQSPNYVTPVSLELNDVLAVTANAVSVDGYVSSWWDGVNIGVPPGTRLGLAYTQDGLVQPHRVNPATRNLGLPNAYWLPRVEPYGQPVYDPGTEAGLYLWQDEASGVWHLRGAAGGGNARYIGELASDQPFVSVAAVGLEANDVLDTTDPARIVFNLGMGNQWEDGIDFQAAPGAQLSLNLTTGSPFAPPARAVRVGNRQWPVGNLPLDLSGW